jgi:hypothetical protein
MRALLEEKQSKSIAKNEFTLLISLNKHVAHDKKQNVKSTRLFFNSIQIESSDSNKMMPQLNGGKTGKGL